MTTETCEDITPERKAWKAPEVRAIIPSKRTAGGPFGMNDQEDSFYSVS